MRAPLIFMEPKEFLCLKTVESVDIDNDGFVDGVHSQGDSVYYELDEALTLLLRTRTPVFVH
jgi:hypothetical protein